MIPLPFHTVFERIKLGGAGANPAEAIGRVQLRPTVLQEFRPLTRCLEWELSELHWNQQGILPFVENDVPFLINNSGRLSEHAAALLFANCLETLGAGSIRVLELGAGTGLFARYFLNAFRAICLQENRDFYQRLIYYVTDRSMRTVQQWQGKFSLTAGKPARIKIILDDFQYLTKYPWVTYLQLMSNYVAGT